MASSLLTSSLPSLPSSPQNPNPLRSKSLISFPLSFLPTPLRRRHTSPPTAQIPDEWGDKSVPEPQTPDSADPPKNDDEWGPDPGRKSPLIADEWGDKAEPEIEATSPPDATKDDDEWGAESADGYFGANGTTGVGVADKLGDLKRCLVDTLYGREFGLKASVEERAEIFELVSQLEAENPNSAPNERPELLDGEWVLLYTAFSELIPLVAVGQLPLLKVKKISQTIYTQSRTIVNATTISSPFASISFSATASFEVQSPTRIQVQFKEGAFQPPEISSTLDLPEKIDIFGQKIDLKPFQQTLNPIQQAVANITRALSGQPPLKVPIPGERTKSWLLTTYLDEDFRISRGDGGLFVLAKEGSPLLDQLL